MNSEFFLVFLFILFAIGAVAIHIISRKKEKPIKINAWKKFFVYFLIINSIFLCIIYVPILFKIVCFLVALGGAVEILRLQISSIRGGLDTSTGSVSGCRSAVVEPVETPVPLKWSKFVLFFSMYIGIAVLFCFFAFATKEIQILTVFTVCTFDAFSQLSGQLFGKRKITPIISPNKTLGGLVGGASIALVLGVVANLILARGCLDGVYPELSRGARHDGLVVIILILCVIAASFVGDLAASYIKRQYAVKDFSRLLPGHGGILDRFDSWVVAGAVMVLLNFYWL
ncbi:MAG: phosphatidate cytidylyltransferase [Bacteroidales bacterium]|nr:phosphatidate cytidylyltransferase [Bacteroidales bacterium]